MDSGTSSRIRRAIGRRVGVFALTAGLLLGAVGGAAAQGSVGSAGSAGAPSTYYKAKGKSKCNKKGKAKKGCGKSGKGKGGKSKGGK